VERLFGVSPDAVRSEEVARVVAPAAVDLAGNMSWSDVTKRVAIHVDDAHAIVELRYVHHGFIRVDVELRRTEVARLDVEELAVQGEDLNTIVLAS
jgi:hypothetical protein